MAHSAGVVEPQEVIKLTENVLNLGNLRLAVLIDAENVPRNCIKRVMEEIAIYGTPTIKRIYGDWTSSVVSGWKTSLLENAITPIQQYSYTTGKNSSDSAMIIDAMDILYSEKTDGFVIVSSDSDFTRLAIRLREAGQRVIGVGERKTPNAFIAACDKFTYIEIIRAGLRRVAEIERQTPDAAVREAFASRPGVDYARPEADPTRTEQESFQDSKGPHDSHNPDSSKDENREGGKTEQEENGHKQSGQQREKASHTSRQRGAKVPNDIVRLIADSVADLAGDDGIVFMGELGNLMQKKQPDFDHRNFGYMSLSAMIKSIGRFEIDFRQTADPNIKHVFVRDREA